MTARRRAAVIAIAAAAGAATFAGDVLVVSSGGVLMPAPLLALLAGVVAALTVGRRKVTPLALLLLAGAITGSLGVLVGEDPWRGAVALERARGGLIAARFSSDARRLLGATTHDEVALWDVTTGAITTQFRGPGLETRALEISPDGDLVIAGTFDGLVLFDATEGERVAVFSQLHRTFAGFDSLGRIIAYGHNRTVVDPGGRCIVSAQPVPDSRYYMAMAFRDGVHAGLDFSRRRVVVVEGATERRLATRRLEDDVDLLSVSPGGQFVVLRERAEGWVRLLDIATGEVRPTALRRRTDQPLEVVPDGSRAVSVVDGVLLVEATGSGERLARAPLRRARGRLVTISSDGRMIIVETPGESLVVPLDRILAAGQPLHRRPMVWFQVGLAAALAAALASAPRRVAQATGTP